MTGDSGDPGAEQVGSVGEEAAKLLSALQGWAAQARADDAAAGTPGPASGLRGLGEHLATGGQDCVWCPVCQVIHRVRQSSPEIRAHLATAASSLLQAAAALLDSHSPPGGAPAAGSDRVQHIDLDDEAD